ncbi:type II secretion system protein M [Pseudomonas sp. Gutcm_11s]|uniref:type II secretion system protein M n=1 Tax=Pseudomonas sp. Gutcm_11s TaxID=3026088 RepID=UPI00235FC9BA|nr:type II secretion system protein M [Pseudomonas sp. Gutcm_11s]MDD0842618.1 type II secretion system protein M [Pseudomonas sp. Gutcm_11s]
MSTLASQLRGQIANNPLAVRWHGMPPRDRLALALLGGFLLLVLLYLLLWRPVSQNLEQARSYLQQQRALHAYLQEHAPQVRAQQGKPQVSVDPTAMQGLVTASAASQGLNIDRLDNQGDGGLQVSLQPTDFARLLRWLINLEEQGVRVEEAGLERAEKGLVSTRLLLRAG